MAGVHNNILKAYKVGLLVNLVRVELFKPDNTVIEQLKNEESIWFSLHKREVILTVDKKAAAHFKRRQLVPSQHIIKELEDGSLIVSSYISHDLQILPIVRYWIPHVRVLSPDSLREACLESLTAYLEY